MVIIPVHNSYTWRVREDHQSRLELRSVRATNIIFLLTLIIAGAVVSTNAQCPDVGALLLENVEVSAGHPLQGEWLMVVETTDTNGANHIRVVKTKGFRDKNGKVRIERWYGPALQGDREPAPATAIRDVTIVDPCGTSWLLYPSLHTAEEHDLPVGKQPNSPHYCAESDPINPPRPPPNETFEILGHRLMAGVDAIGSRQDTYSSLEAKASGASPIRTLETWCSPELNLALDFHERDDKDGREINQTTISIQLGDPDPSLFEIPSDYTVDHARENTTVKARSTSAAK
jgi:hypothetical protein